MYMSHKRLDIQHCVKTLAGSMVTPTEHAEHCLIQLILHPKNAADLSFKLFYTKIGTRMSGKLNNSQSMKWRMRSMSWKFIVTVIGQAVYIEDQQHQWSFC